MRRAIFRFVFAVVGLTGLISFTSFIGASRPGSEGAFVVAVDDTLWTRAYNGPGNANDGALSVLVDRAGLSVPAKSGEPCVLPTKKLGIPVPWFATTIDSSERTIQIYVGDYDIDRIMKYEIDSSLQCVAESLTTPWGAVSAVTDFDLDGNMELLVQRGDPGLGGNGYLDILSAPNWDLRRRFVFPGEKIGMGPVPVNVDDDPYIEIFAIPQGFNTLGHAIVIDFVPASGTFEIVADVYPPFGASANAAVADFDNDGNMEFVVGNYAGYELLEWRDDTLVYVGPVMPITSGSRRNAIACRPLPNGLIHALVSFSRESGFDYYLLEPTGDNSFRELRTFHDSTGAIGSTPCAAADTDCDGLDELVMGFFPRFEVWEWDTSQLAFAVRCQWDYSMFGSNLNYWYTLDLNWDGRPEWCPVTNFDTLLVLPDPNCIVCDGAGRCVPPPPICFCSCHADPQCDGQTDIVDVVLVVDLAFRSHPDLSDLSVNCPNSRTDVDCSHATDVVDVVRVIDVAFRGAVAAQEFCDPCP